MHSLTRRLVIAHLICFSVFFASLRRAGVKEAFNLLLVLICSCKLQRPGDAAQGCEGFEQ